MKKQPNGQPPAPPRRLPRTGRPNKGEVTRSKIILAARRVFTEYPYHAASLRMIGQQGGFTHSYVRYHFQTKSQLFAAVGQQLYEEYFAGVSAIIEDTAGLSLSETFSQGVRRFIDFSFQHPEAFHLLLLNMAEADQFDELKGGLRYLQKFQQEIHRVFAGHDAFRASERLIGMWIACFKIVTVSYVGAARFYIPYLNMGSDDRYRTFVTETLLFLFRTPLACLLSGEKDRIKRLPAKALPRVAKKKGSPQKAPPKQPEPVRKGEVTRKRILEVARKLFTHKPYNTVGIRMIGEAGGFDFTLLYHYFANKGELFEAVATELSQEYKQGIESLLHGIRGDSLHANMSLLVNRAVDYFFEHPDAMLISMQNIAQVGMLEEIPGAHYLPLTIIEAQRMLGQVIGVTDKRIYPWFYALCIVLFSCLGASTYHAHVLNMDPRGPRYKRWVKDMLMFIFYPALETITQAPSAPEPG